MASRAGKPGPGWSRGRKSERWAPHYLVNEDFRGSAVVANVFRILAALILIGGAISAAVTGHDMHQNGYSNAEVTEAVIGIVVGTIVSASAMLFFTFVLELLRAIHFDLRHDDAVKANSAASSPNGATKPSGWYPSPGDEGTLRWWDGQRWTDQTLERQL
jgi:hypothetical protein